MRFLRHIVGAYPRQTLITLMALLVAGLVQGVSLSALLPVLNLALDEEGAASDNLLVESLQGWGFTPSLGMLLGVVVAAATWVRGHTLVLPAALLGFSLVFGPRSLRLAGTFVLATLLTPVLLDVGYEAWRAKEARAGDEVADVWGPIADRGPTWEAVTATDLLQGGCDLLIMRHPKAMEAIRNASTQLVGG